MEIPQTEELGEAGQAFRAAIDRDEIAATLGEHIVAYIDELPDEVLGAYAGMQFHHVTLASTVPVIEAEGLRERSTPIEEPDQEFFLSSLSAFHGGLVHPQDIATAKNLILGAPEGTVRQISATGNLDDFHIKVYAVPETVKFFLRNLRHLLVAEHVDPSLRERAAELIQKYTERIVQDGEVQSAVLKIDPRSPAMIGAILCRTDFRMFGSNERALSGLSTLQKDGDLKLIGDVAPQYISLERIVKTPESDVMPDILQNSGLVLFKPYTGERV